MHKGGEERLFRLEENETILFSDTDKRPFEKATPYLAVFLALTSLMLLKPFFVNALGGALSFNSKNEYVLAIWAFALLLPGSMYLFFSYKLNKFIVTDQRIFISKGIHGRSFVIKVDDVAGFASYLHTGRAGPSFDIEFLLNNGNKLKTAGLKIKPVSFDKLEYILQDALHFRKLDKRETIIAKSDQSKLVYKNNLLPVLCLIPLAIAGIMFVLYIGGINDKVGAQSDIEISGFIVQLNTSSSKSGSKRTIIVRDEKTKAVYGKINVSNQEQFAGMKTGDKVTITAKKGSLGIVYDIDIH